MNGVLLVDKPSGKTSARVVAVVKRLTGARRVGHTGTLDPMATGVLPICIGEGTKLAGYLQGVDKEYTGEFLLGVETDTLDKDGEVTRVNVEAAANTTMPDVASVFESFVGKQQQVPPMFSAIKVNGERLHRLARKGIDVERPPRDIEVTTCNLEEFSQPRGQFRIACSKGTYVRTVIADVGSKLGCGAHLTSLRRTKCGRFSEKDCVELDHLTAETIEPRLIPVSRAIDHMQALQVPQIFRAWVGNGRKIPISELDSVPSSRVFRLIDEAGNLLALARCENDMVRYERVFSYALTPD